MTIHCLGSINIDHVYRVPHAPAAGETLADQGYAAGLGGKGANHAIAAARAGADVRFIGAVGPESGTTREALAKYGINTTGITDSDEATGHAIILVEPNGENRIIIHPGANRAITPAQIDVALTAAQPGDWWLTQNETNAVVDSTAQARAAGLRTAHAAAPFDPVATKALLPHLDLLAVNEGEANALAAHLNVDVDAIPVPSLLVTLGAEGARWRGEDNRSITVPAFPVDTVDTTGAGDTFFGTVLAGIDTGLTLPDALHRAAAAAALCVTRPGAAEAIPSAADVTAFLENPA